MGSLLPSNESAPKFAQLYIYDVANEVSNRMSQFPHSTPTSSLDETIVGDLIQMLASTNCLVGLFRHASLKLSEPTNPVYKLQLLCQRTNDTRQYNDPTSNDIGGLIVGDIGDYWSERDIIIETWSNTLQRNSKLHPKFMALQYPLLFPFGEDGYQTNISFANHDGHISRKHQRVPMRAFYAYLIQEREYGEDTLIKGGRLYQQFLVDAFANNEEDRLDYIRMNQNDLWPDLYHNISEVVLKGDVQGSSTGKIILPSSVTDVYAIEFRKRGLPHTHILIWLASKFKFKTTNDIDSIVSAKIPDKNIDPLCHEIVSKFMIHGPCGVARPGAQCMSGNVCTKSFPKKFRSSTTLGNNGFVYYRRREFRDNFVLKNGIMLFNDYVAPYNKELLMRYNAQIKYLFKNVSKGPDRCRAILQNDTDDEIQAYLNCHFICPYEAVWRIFQFPIHSSYPPFERLQIHLSFQQNIVFSGNESLQSVLRRPGELYFLRLLLNYIKGSTGFADLRKIRGIVYPTFQLACKAYGLLGDDKEWSKAFCEAIATASSPQLR
uniref:Helitron helicase-like domain-containing protein n=1 Tax=Salix viminalis TaxID=40686 RepID=A0A6N2LWX4_SALVM